MTSSILQQPKNMLYVQQFQAARTKKLKEYQRLRTAADRNFFICSNEYAEKFIDIPESNGRKLSNNRKPQENEQERSKTVLVVTRIPPNNETNLNDDSSILNVVS